MIYLDLLAFGISGILLYILLFILFIAFIVSIIILIAQWKMFAKAGEEGWKALIPIYNTWIMIKLTFGEGKEWLISGTLFAIVGNYIDGPIGSFMLFAGVIMSVYISYNFIRRFAGVGMSIASLIVPVIIYPIVGFSSKYKYTPPTIYFDNEYTL